MGPILEVMLTRKEKENYFILSDNTRRIFNHAIMVCKTWYRLFSFCKYIFLYKYFYNGSCFVLYNSLLSSSTNKKNYGILSGLSWGAGYVAGIISLLLCLVLFIFPEKLMFGLTKENGENIRACMLFISIWMMVFAIPLFIFTSEPEKNKTNKSTFQYIKQGCIFIFNEKLIFRFFYQDYFI